MHFIWILYVEEIFSLYLKLCMYPMCFILFTEDGSFRIQSCAQIHSFIIHFYSKKFS
jgi:hypothetical protein